MNKTIDDTKVLDIADQADFFGVGYEVEDGGIVRTVDNGTLNVIVDFGRVSDASSMFGEWRTIL